MAQNVLVTGGTGFIGTHLVKALAHEGHHVRVLDLKWPNQKIPGVEYFKGDVGDTELLARAARDTFCIFHLAALVSVPLCQVEPFKSYSENLMNTCNVLEVLKTNGEKSGRKIRLVFSGSSAVYGSLGEQGQSVDEAGVCVPPTTFYMAQKLASEHAISLYHSAFGIPAVVFRFFNVYGAGQDSSSPYSGVISKFSSQIIQNQPLILYGGGHQTRDFVAVEDIVSACVLALKLPDSACDAVPINLGSGKSTAIRQLAFNMMEIFQARVPVLVGPERNGEVVHSRASIDRASNILKWRPTLLLEDGLRALYSGYAERGKRPKLAG